MPAASRSCVVAIAQIAPVWLRPSRDPGKNCQRIAEAGRSGARLVVFGEAVLPGYPFWIEHTDGARFESRVAEKPVLRTMSNKPSTSATVISIPSVTRPAKLGSG